MHEDHHTPDSKQDVSSSGKMDNFLTVGLILLVPILLIITLSTQNYTLAVGLIVGYLPTLYAMLQPLIVTDG